MRACVTGAAGFLGSHLCDALVNLGWDVIGVDNLLGGDRTNIPSSVQFIEADCTVRGQWERILAECSTVVHCAAAPYEGLSVFSPHLVFHHTAASTSLLISLAARYQVQRFIFLSSMARYGSNRTPYTEDMLPRPIDPYGVSKVAAEGLVQSVGDAHGIDWRIVVPHNIVGPRQKFTDPYRNVVSIMVNRMLQDERPIIYGDGEQTRCFSHIDDVLHCLILMITRPDLAREIINVGPDEGSVTINQLADEIARQLGRRSDPIYLPERPLEVKHALCSSNKARQLLGYETRRTLSDSVASVIEWIKRCGSRPFEHHLCLEIPSPSTPSPWYRGYSPSMTK
jgi:UDP-glucose 4-epimerase